MASANTHRQERLEEEESKPTAFGAEDEAEDEEDGDDDEDDDDRTVEGANRAVAGMCQSDR